MKFIFGLILMIYLIVPLVQGATRVSRSKVLFPTPIETDLFHAHYEELHVLKSKGALGPLKITDEELSGRVRLRNQELISKFRTSVGNSGLGVASRHLKETADFVLKRLMQSPVASPNALSKYDPTGDIGFCFGRATFVHLELIRLGFDPNKIGKIFALGNLSYQKRPWDFHVATFIWDNDAVLVIDDTVKEVMSLENWIKVIESFDFDPQIPMMTVFLTDPIKFHPALQDYDRPNFERPIYNSYFKDLVKTLSFDLNIMFK